MFTTSRLRKKRDEKEEGCFFLKNGAAVLEKLIRCFNGDCNPIRSYSAKELKEATSDFRWIIHEGENYIMYEGVHEHRSISVKKFTAFKDDELERIANEVAIASRMSNHKNVLKLLGCCLETELPVLVYEFPAMGNLESHIYYKNQDKQLTWEQKLRIASGIANATAYLHHGLSKTTILRNIHPSNIFLDQNNVAKLFNFQDALPIPEGEAHIDAEVVGTFRFVAPEIAEKGGYAEGSDSNLSTFLVDEPEFDREASSAGRYTEKSDVYGFGVLFLEVLTGMRGSTYFFWRSKFPHERISSFSLRSCKSSLSLDGQSSLGGQFKEFYEEMLREHFDICSQEGENRSQESSNVRLDDFSEEMMQEHCDTYPKEEDRVPVNSRFQIEKFYASVFKEYSEVYAQEEDGVQKLEYIKLVQRCLKENPDDRPDMIEVGKALRLIKNM